MQKIFKVCRLNGRLHIMKCNDERTSNESVSKHYIQCRQRGVAVVHSDQKPRTSAATSASQSSR